MKLKYFYLLPLLAILSFSATTSQAAKNKSVSSDRVLKEIEIKDKLRLQVVADAKGKVFYNLIEDGKSVHKSPLSGVNVKPENKNPKKELVDQQPVVKLVKLTPLADKTHLLSFVMSPINPGSEIEIETNRIEVIKDGKIIHGPQYDSIGYGEGGAVIEFDLSDLKSKKQVHVLEWVPEDAMAKYPDLKVIRKDTMADESFSVLNRETYTWNGKGWDKKIHFEN